MNNLEYNPEKGGYKKTCPVCHEIFYGRENKIYCNEKCKSVKAYQKLKKKKSLIHDDAVKMIYNAQILEKLDNEFKGKQCPINRLTSENFKANVPIRTVQDKNGNKWNIIGIYAYRNIDNENLIISKL